MICELTVHPITYHEDMEWEVQLYCFFNLSPTRWGGWLTPHPGCFTLRNYLVAIV